MLTLLTQKCVPKLSQLNNGDDPGDLAVPPGNRMRRNGRGSPPSRRS
jgi:hypothetical protein